MRPTNGSWPFCLNYFKFRFRGRKPDPGPLFRTNTQLDKQCSNASTPSKGHMFSGTSVGSHIYHTITLQISTFHTSFFRISVRL
eukprot:5031420-Amphidinium_carterae.1